MLAVPDRIQVLQPVMSPECKAESSASRNETLLPSITCLLHCSLGNNFIEVSNQIVVSIQLITNDQSSNGET